MLDLDRVFGDDGLLAQRVDGYHPRQAQLEMARCIEAAIVTRSNLIVEAGTGTGKTFAYLVPALLSGEKVLLSTGTKTLQDQLFRRDIPALRRILPLSLTVAVLKGRSNYLCHHHLEQARRQGGLFDHGESAALEKMALWATSTPSGDIAELVQVPENHPLWSRVTSTRDNCLGTACAHQDRCFVAAARRQALQADLVVINHHLFFADILLRDEGAGELLPRAGVVIFDEAHQLPAVASAFLGDSISTQGMVELTRDVLASLEILGLEKDALLRLGRELEHQTREFARIVARREGRVSREALFSRPPVDQVWEGLVAALGRFEEGLASQPGRNETIDQYHALAREMTARLRSWRDLEMGQVHWIECQTQGIQFNSTPLELGESLRPQWTDRCWIFTSATLSAQGNFDHFRHEMGLEEALAQHWDSPFDYPHQSLLYVPPHLPAPGDDEHTTALIAETVTLIEANRGRAFLLFTTHRALNQAHRLLKQRQVEGNWPYPLMVQGERSRTQLLERFRDSGNGVLLGTTSFWEGVDIRGDALSLVVLDKMPFAPPGDPVLAARIEHLRSQGKNPFRELQLPQAILGLKQGAGRLIRSETDRGVLVIGDPRLLNANYSESIWRSLPPMRRTREVREVIDFLSSGSG